MRIIFLVYVAVTMNILIKKNNAVLLLNISRSFVQNTFCVTRFLRVHRILTGAEIRFRFKFYKFDVFLNHIIFIIITILWSHCFNRTVHLCLSISFNLN